MSHKTILRLLYGGKSAEHEVSLQTALSVINALDRKKYDVLPVYITPQGVWKQGEKLTAQVDHVHDLILEKGSDTTLLPTPWSLHRAETEVVFPLLHGPNGEDGTVQGLLELLNIPYVGNGVAASAVGMDKVFMKQVFAQNGLAQPKYVYFWKKDWQMHTERVYENVEDALSYPCFVKPANLGSSVGISKCEKRDELEMAFEVAFQFDRKVIVEEGIAGREIEIALLGNDDPICSVAGEIIPEEGFYDYDAKYQDGKTELVIPAELPARVHNELNDTAVKAYKAINATGLGRVDFFVTRSDEVLINEINTMPGFTPYSMFPLLWKHSGINYSELIERLVQLALERHQEKQSIKHTMDERKETKNRLS